MAKTRQKPSADPTLAIPPDTKLSHRAYLAAETILTVLRRHKATYTGGCQLFHDPAAWRKLGHRGGQSAMLVVAYEGSEAGEFFELDRYQYGRIEAMRKALAAAGVYAEPINGWSSGIYPLDPTPRTNPSRGRKRPKTQRR